MHDGAELLTGQPRRARPSLVVVNYASASLLEVGLAPLAREVRSQRPDAVVVVVDNWSSAPERQRARAMAEREGWVLVEAPNTGFGDGVNTGIAAARAAGAAVHVVINPDATASAADLDVLLRRVESDPMLLVAPEVRTPEGTLWSALNDLHLVDGSVRSARHRREDDAVVPWVSGACFAVTDHLWDTVGGFRAEYFLYWEDIDLCHRVQQAGGRVEVDADAVVIHDEGGTQRMDGRGSAKSTTHYYYTARNRLLFAATGLDRRARVRWIAATPRVAWRVVLHGERRRLLQDRQPLVAAARGVLAGLLRRWEKPAAALPRTTADRPAVVVAVLTYRRPRDLAELLPQLTAQLAEVSERVSRGRLLVVDNDPDAGAAAVVAAAAASSPPGVEVVHVHEPRPGIAAARDRALRDAAHEDLLVFIDDDERPVPGWLSAHLATWRARRPAAVVGPVTSAFATHLDPWVQAGGFFHRRRLPTGSAVSVAATNNLLLDLRAVRAAGLSFDAGFGTAGGEDTLFTRRLHARGGELLWCAEAGVTDIVPCERATRRWVVRRAYSSGNAWTRTAVLMAPGSLARTSARTAGVARGGVRLVAGLGRLGAGALRPGARGLSSRARGVRTAARGAGMLMGALEVGYDEYRRPRRAATARR
ncbi:glycosyltransferase family 2 protein [Quadrisphaera granulorum]|nr:glycosyltransferase family 2 protein [Quadrisphaera granulorum]